MRRRRRWWRVVAVAGPSMVPTLRDGDVVIVRPGARIRPDDVVVARFASRPDPLVVKRAGRPVPGGWWLESDNPYAGGDSTVHGPAVVEGRAVLVLRRGRPHRIGPRPPTAPPGLP